MSAGVPGPALAHATAALDELEPSATTERLAALLIEIYDIGLAAEAFDASWAAARRLHGLLDQLPPSRLLVDALAVLSDERAITGHAREAIEITNRSMTVTRSLDDDRAWAVAARARGEALMLIGWISQAEALFDAAAALPFAFESTPRSFVTAIDMCWVPFLAGRFAESGHAAAELRRVATRYGVERRYAPWYLVVEAEAAFELGRLDEAERFARSAGAHKWTGSWRVIAKVAAVRGLLDAARAASRPDAMGDPLWRLEAEAFIERAAGDFDRVRARIEEAARTTTDIVPPLCRLLGTGIGAAADRAVAARRRRHLVDAVETSRLGAEWFAWLQAILDDARANGGAGRYLEATLATAEAECQRLRGTFDPLMWGRAAGQWRALLDLYETAYAELRLAEALLETDGDRFEVARLLRGAHAVTIGLGAAPLRSEVETVARHARVELVPEPAEAASQDAGLPAQQSAGPTLTARERDVLRLVAEGHTNREIAERLFISEKTASVHVSNAMAKLGALSRYEAAAAADRAGQLD
jgi:DNA-binding CsgD family transcriptional regulator